MIKVTIEQWLPATDWQGKPTHKAVKTLRIFGIKVYTREMLVPAGYDAEALTRSYLTQF